MTQFPILETARLILRPPHADDLDGWADFHADAETMKFLGGTQSRAEAWRSLCGMVGAWHVRGFAMFSLILKDTGQWIGRIGPWYPEGWPGTEVGWGVLRAYEGKGYGVEAAVASLDYAFDVLGWDDVMHIIAPANLPSIALAQRLGSTNRGRTQMPEPFHEHVVDNWGQTRAEWQQNRKKFV
jgi:RimJ/RimL family protein N-acetyltransferase